MKAFIVRWRRPLAVVGIAAVLAGPSVVDRFVDRMAPDVSAFTRAVNPGVSPLGAGTSTWFCASGRTTTENVPDLTVTIANVNDVEVPGRVTWFTEEIGRQPVVQPVLAGPNARVDVAAPPSVAGGAVAALVEFDAGGIAAEHRVSGPFGGASAPCASDAGARWVTADGATTIDARTTLSVFNPFPEDALLDVRFVTDRGTALPAALQGVSIAARSVQEIDVGAFVRRRRRVAAIVRARIGRVVVERVTTFDGSGRQRGMTISPATPAASATWYFAAGRTSSVFRERYALFNPTRQPVTAIIDVLVDGVAGVEPFEIEIPPLDVAELVPGDESRIARNVGYSVVVSTDDGTEIVVERTIDARGRLRRGFASSPGSLLPAESWVIPDAEASPARSDTLSLLNPTDTNAIVSFRILGENGVGVAVPAATDFLVAASSRLDVRLGDYVAVSGRSLVVTSPGTPIVVERSMQAIDTPGDRPFVDPLPTEANELASAPIVDATLPAEIPDSLALVTPPTTSTAATTTTTPVPATTTTTTARVPVIGATTLAAPPSSATTSVVTTTSVATPTSTTTTVAPEPTIPETRSRAVAPRIGRAKLGTSVGPAIPFR